jgi:hypothetical protein
LMSADGWTSSKRSGPNFRENSDSVNLNFVRTVVGKARVAGGAIISRTPNSFSLGNGFRALPVSDGGFPNHRPPEWTFSSAHYNLMALTRSFA